MTLIIQSGDIVAKSGYYIYAGNPNHGQIPCDPLKDERVKVLEQGTKAPRITSCNNHPAKWELVTEKKSTPLLHND